MGKKRKNSKPKKRKALASADIRRTVAENIASARVAMTRQDYKESLKIYKSVWKTEKSDAIRLALSDCYLLRARELANKGMYLEACALWNNRLSLGPEAQHVDDYFNWLIAGCRFEKAIHVLNKYVDELKSLPTYSSMLAQLSPYFLVQQNNVAAITQLNLDETLQKARTACIEFTQAKDAIAAQQAIKTISLRSPFRALRLVLHALSARSMDSKKSLDLTDKIPRSSPYYAIVHVIQLCRLPVIELLSALLTLRPKQKQLLAILQGWDPSRLKAIEKVAKIVSQGSIKQQVNLLLNNQQYSDEATVYRLCVALLSTGSPGMRTAVPLSPFDAMRIRALHAERKKDPYGALDHWDHCVDILLSEGKTKENTQKVGLIKLHQYTLSKIIDRYFEHEEEPVVYLKASLAYLPRRKQTYLDIVRYYKAANDTKNYRKHIKEALALFPDELELLLAAAEDAFHRKAYKKAITQAKRVLTLDPIHGRAKKLIGLASVASIRKLAVATKYRQALKEIVLTQAYGAQLDPPNLLGVLQGVIHYAGNATAVATLQKAIVGDHAHLMLMVALVEAKLILGKAAPMLEKHLKEQANITLTLPNSDALLALMVQLTQYAKTHAVTDAVNFVISHSWAKLKRVISPTMGVDKMRQLCDLFVQLNQFTALKEISAVGRKAHSRSPAFIYFAVYAKYRGKGHGMQRNDFQRLDRAFAAAKAAGDTRLCQRMSTLLMEASERHMEFPPEIERIIERMVG